MMLTTEQFDRIRKLALRLAGIELFERHHELLGSRSCRLGIRDLAGIDALLGAAEAGDPRAGRRLIGLVTTNFTGFFRHPRHFEIAAEHALGAAHRRGQARLWSAAAATGEEPYSLAMAVIERFGGDEVPVTILATDIDEEALAAAQRGAYDDRALGALDSGRRGRFFSGEAIAPEVRRLVEFRPLNLAEAGWAVEGPFDVILCRNVLMYLEADHRYSVLEQMVSLLAPDGVLILDPTEYLGRGGHWFLPGTEGVYRRRSATARLDTTGVCAHPAERR